MESLLHAAPLGGWRGGIRVRVSGRCLCDVHPAAAGVLLGADGGEGVHGVGSLTHCSRLGKMCHSGGPGLGTAPSAELNFFTEIHGCRFPSYQQETQRAAFSSLLCGSSLSIAEG